MSIMRLRVRTTFGLRVRVELGHHREYVSLGSHFDFPVVR